MPLLNLLTSLQSKRVSTNPTVPHFANPNPVNRDAIYAKHKLRHEYNLLTG
jgi:hypothetical protein